MHVVEAEFFAPLSSPTDIKATEVAAEAGDFAII